MNKNHLYSLLAIGGLMAMVGAFSICPSVVLAAAPEPAYISILTNVINDNGGLNNATDFIIHITGASSTPDSFFGSATGVPVKVNAGEPYAVSVATLSYTSAFSPKCLSSLTPGENAVCTITLDDVGQIPSGQPGPNLIQNPSLETSALGQPSQWNQGGWGNNNRVFAYPVNGVGGGVAANITITAYTDGDAKWYFSEVPVLAGHSYNFSDNYISGTSTELAADYFDSNHNHIGFGGFFAVSPSATNTWSLASAIFTPPAGTAYMTVYHIIKSTGSLTTDNFKLSEIPLPKSFGQGFVSLTFDDGLVSQYENALPILKSANMKGNFYIISHLISGISIINPSLETANGSIPQGWNKSGSASTTYNYPVAGHTGTKAAEVRDTHIGSNATWYFDPVTIVPDYVYSFSEWYKSTTASELVAMVVKNDGTTEQVDATDANGNFIGNSIPLASTGNSWTQIQTYFYVPVNAKNITVINRLQGDGQLTIDDVSLGAKEHMNSSQILDLQANGQEIGGHSQSHRDLTTLSPDDAASEINGVRQDLLNNGINSVKTFSYPYGNTNENIQGLVQNGNYTTGRTVTPGFNGQDTNLFGLLSQSINADTPLSLVESWIDQAKNDRDWLILTLHDIKNDLANSPYGMTPANLQTIVDYLSGHNIPVRSMSDSDKDITAPVITLIGSSTVNITFNSNFTDPGATATDNVDGNIATSSIVVSGDIISSSTPAGTYHIYYNVSDAAGNKADQAVRTVIIPALEISLEQKTGVNFNNVVIAWITSHPATSRMLWDTISHSSSSCQAVGAPNYGYASSTAEDNSLTLAHSVNITGLNVGTTYYFRPVSHGSPVTLGNEVMVTTQNYSFGSVDSTSSGGSTSGGGSGGGGGSSVANSNAITNTETSTTTAVVENKEIKVLGIESPVFNTPDNLYGVDNATVEKITSDEAGKIMACTGAITLSPNNQKIYDKIVKNYLSVLSDSNKQAIKCFIQNGTQTTKRLGAGERAGVVNFFAAVFARMPVSALDWQDVIKAANGRWPKQRNAAYEAKMKTSHFVNIYGRNPDVKKPADNSVIAIMSYGLLPVNRNFNTEKAAIKSFMAKYGYSPKSAKDWVITRAIGYSGAKR